MRRRGIALAYVLAMMALILVLIMSLFVQLRSQLQLTRQYSRRAAALYAAEAGVALAMSEMENDKAWILGYQSEPLSSGLGTFSIRFHQPGEPHTRELSVNNLRSDDWATSYRGTHTVPPRSALLVVTGEVEGVKRHVEVLIQPGGGDNVDEAALVSGRVRMAGNVIVLGVRSLRTMERMEAGVHSNLVDDEPGLMRYLGGGTAWVGGEVASSGTNPRAVQFPPEVRQRYNAPVKQLPYVDIPATIASKRSRPAPRIGEFNGVPNYLPAGEYYHEGDLIVDSGNLVLNNTELYVSGRLTINGSIVGRGAVFVGDKTELKGTTAVTTSDENFVALFSKGSVHLQGFDWLAYFDEMAERDRRFARTWRHGRRARVREREERYDRAGSASLVGLVYTNGFVYAQQNVGIWGAVIARDDGSQPAEVIDGTSLAPGDLFLERGAGLLFVEEFFKDGAIFRDLQGLGVTSWLER